MWRTSQSTKMQLLTVFYSKILFSAYLIFEVSDFYHFRRWRSTHDYTEKKPENGETAEKVVVTFKSRRCCVRLLSALYCRITDSFEWSDDRDMVSKEILRFFERSVAHI